MSGPSAALTPLANRHSTMSSSIGVDNALSQVRPSSAPLSAENGVETAERSQKLSQNKVSESAPATAVKVGE